MGKASTFLDTLQDSTTSYKNQTHDDRQNETYIDQKGNLLLDRKVKIVLKRLKAIDIKEHIKEDIAIDRNLFKKQSDDKEGRELRRKRIVMIKMNNADKDESTSSRLHNDKEELMNS